ncbi:MAG TPA: hypothetical protein ENJ93_10235 [Chloroflexi bacterium]|nr:hypothetical protein [Chloroflexota bacterium]
MNESQHNIKVGVATEEQVNREFIDAWRRAQQDEIEDTEESLYFLEPANFFSVLTSRRIALLRTLRAQGSSSIRALSKTLGRDYKNVYQDVQILSSANLIQKTSSQKIFVPWEKIQAEINLA